jgi:O-antigen/teichoic acid export membrane protein
MAGGRARLFIENFLIYGSGNVLTKAIPFLMLPVLTRLIRDPAVFGVFDIFNIIIQFATPGDF